MKTKLLILSALLAYAAGIGRACENPVFDYALRNWEAGRYPAQVQHAGQLSPAIKKLTDSLRAAAEKANLGVEIRTVKASEAGDGPVLNVLYPRGARIPRPAWSVPLTAEAIGKLANSPARQKLAAMLSESGAVPWIILACGDPEKDKKALLEINRVLEPLAATITEEYAEDAEEAGREEFIRKITFPLLLLSRDEPAEEAFISMLINSEPDLKDYSDMPMAFPVFGRGRVLYALIGKGITDSNITKAARFLTGPCSCLVKEGNPGVDMLMTADWPTIIKNYGAAIPVAPPPLPSPVVGPRKAGPAPAQPAPPSSSFVTILIISLVILAFCVALGGIILYRRRSIP